MSVVDLEALNWRYFSMTVGNFLPSGIMMYILDEVGGLTRMCIVFWLY